MYETKDIIEAAKTIRSYLSQQLDDIEAQRVDQGIVDLLDQTGQGEAIDIQLLELLAANDVTREWLKKYMEHLCPPEIQRLFSPLPGSQSPVQGITKYVCPNGDYVWYKIRLGEPTKLCPTHEIPLVESED